MKSLLTLLIVFAGLACFGANEGKIKIKVKNIRSKAGHILVSIYNHASQFPRKPFKVVKIDKKEVKNGEVTYVVEDLENGEYAISLLDDENNNGDMNYSWIGTPQEGYSFSNDAKPKLLSAPDYKDAAFSLGNEDKKIELTVMYW